MGIYTKIIVFPQSFPDISGASTIRGWSISGDVKILRLGYLFYMRDQHLLTFKVNPFACVSTDSRLTLTFIYLYPFFLG